MNKAEITQKLLEHNYAALKCDFDESYQYEGYVQKGGYLSRESYYTIYLHYYILLEKYLESKLPLEKYERKIKCAAWLRILPIDHSKHPYIQLPAWKSEYFTLKIYPILYLLSESDMQTLLSADLQMLTDPDRSLLGLIERTYKTVLDLDRKQGVVHFVDYNNHNLVCHLNIRFAYDEFRKSILGENNLWMMRWNAQHKFLRGILRDMERECSEILGVDTQIIPT